MQLNKVRKDLLEIIDKGNTSGLTIKDYHLLLKLRNILDPEQVAENQEYYQLYKQINKIISKMFYSGILHKYSKNNCEYILKNSPILPLILANDENHTVRIVGACNFMFLCQFHLEKTPSMRVSDIKNTLYCFGCGVSLNTISYLEEYEDLNFKRIIQLLSQIYLYDLKKYDKSLEPLVQKYKQAIIGREYQKLIKESYQRLKQKYGSYYGSIDIDSLYDNRCKIIRRVAENRYDENFHFEEPKKVMFLGNHF